MISFIEQLLLQAGVGAKFTRLIAWVIVVLVIVLLAIAAVSCYNHEIISNHDAKTNLNAAIEDRQADQNQAAQQTIDLQREAYEQDQLRKAVQDAPKDPKIPDDVERNLAFHRCLKLQQDARANGLKPPACV